MLGGREGRRQGGGRGAYDMSSPPPSAGGVGGGGGWGRVPPPKFRWKSGSKNRVNQYYCQRRHRVESGRQTVARCLGCHLRRIPCCGAAPPLPIYPARATRSVPWSTRRARSLASLQWPCSIATRPPFRPCRPPWCSWLWSTLGRGGEQQLGHGPSGHSACRWRCCGHAHREQVPAGAQRPFRRRAGQDGARVPVQLAVAGSSRAAAPRRPSGQPPELCILMSAPMWCWRCSGRCRPRPPLRFGACWWAGTSRCTGRHASCGRPTRKNTWRRGRRARAKAGARCCTLCSCAATGKSRQRPARPIRRHS